MNLICSNFRICLMLFLGLGSLPAFAFSKNTPPDVQISNVSPATCFGAADGSIALTVTGGQAPYTFVWSNGATTPNIGGLTAGLYAVTVTDDNAEQTVLTGIEVAQPQPLVLVLDSLHAVSCNVPLGFASVAPTGGTGPYTFLWNTGQPGNALPNLAPGNYTVTATDAHSCTASLAVSIALDTAASTANAGMDFTVQCNNTVDTLAGTASGGPNLAYFWTTASNTARIASGANTPNPIFDRAGKFALRVTNMDNGCIARDTVQVSWLFDAPVASAAGDTLTCLGAFLTAQYDTTHTAFVWVTPAGDSSFFLNPVFYETGTYHFVVTDTVTTCVTNIAVDVPVDTLYPTAIATGGGLISCAQPTRQLFGAGAPVGIQFSWASDNGFASSEQNPIVNAPGMYVLTTTLPQNGCSTSDTVFVAANFAAPNASASASGMLTCAIPTAQLIGNSATPGATFLWTGPGGFSSTLQNPMVTTAGTYTLQVTDPSNGCTATATATLTANTTPPNATASANGALSCTVNSVQLNGNSSTPGVLFSWTGPGNFTSNAQNPVVIVAGIYTLTVRSTTNGCATTATATVASNTAQPSASASAAGVLTCTVTSAQLSGSSATPGATFSWTGPGGFSSNLQNPTATAPGTYVLTVRDPLNGCSATATAAVSQNIVFPAASATGSALTCTNATGQISASTNVPNATFSWSGPNSFGTHTASATVNVGGIYTVIITNPVNGCTNSAFANVVENRTPPVADAGDDRRLNCHANVVQVQGLASSVGANFSYQWMTLTGNILSGANTLSPRFNAPGTYYLKITNTQNGCTAEDEMDVFLSLPVTAAAAQVNSVSCFGTPTGSAKATPGGGLAPYTYKWSNNAVSANVGGLVAGVYTVTVTDSDGCTASSSTTIAQPTALQATATATPQTQMGVNNGTAIVVPTGGTSPYTVAWSNTQTTTTISNLAPGNYTVTVTDAKSCTVVKTANVSPLNCALSGTVGITPVSCTGGSNGSATVSLNGANGTVTYAWSSGAQTATATNLAAGFYTVTATDAAGCRMVLDAQLLEPQAINLSVVSKTDVGCPDVAGGAITIGAAGGTSPYMSTWSNGQTGVTLNNLMPGSYTVTVTDAKGCTQTLTQQIAVVDANPPVLVLKNATATLDFGGQAIVSPDIFDNGSTDAECSIASWTVSPSTFDCSKVGSQTVTVTATDRNGNVATGTTFVEILDETPPVLTCPGDIFTPACSSVVSFNLPQIADNCPAISDPTLEDGFPAGSAFPAGTTVQVFKYTDGGGQTATCSFAVTVMPAFDVDLSVSQTACAGACDGSARVQNAAGFASILWSNGQSGDAAAGLCAGDHFVTVTDAAGCAVVETVNISAQTGAALTVSADVVAANCATGCDGSATLQITGGTAPFSFAWNNGQASSTATGLCAGNYTATVTDARGCSQTQSVGIVAVDNQLPMLTCPSDIATGACQPGVTFGLPQVSDNCATDPAQIVQIAGLAAGAVFPVGTTVQIFRYTDGGGNVAICSFNVTVHAAPNVVTTAVASCFEQCDGRAMANGFGGLAPLNFQWSNGQTSETAQNLCPGIFTVTVTDASGCSATGTATVQQPAAGLALAVDNVKNDAGGLGNGSIQITPTGGTPPYLFAWTKDGQPFAATEDLNGLFAGQYRLEISDANGCTLAGNAITVQTVVSADEVVAGDISCKIYPNPANERAVLEMSGLFSGGFSVEVFDAAGKLRSRQTHELGAKTLTLDLTECPDGLLWVRVSGAFGTLLRRVAKTAH